MPSLPKQKIPKGTNSSSSKSPANPVVDPRFASLGTDARFRFPSKKNQKTKLDKRFASLLDDEDFTNHSSVDRYGRKVSKDQGRKKLERLYELASSEEEEEDEGKESGEDDEVVLKQLRRAEKNYDPARDGGFSESDSESDEDSALESEVEGELPDEAEEVPMGDVTKRIAVVNLDWDNISAADIFAVSSSFGPAEGGVLRVSVYPSEFGRERMDREDLQGPPKEIFAADPKVKAAELLKRRSNELRNKPDEDSPEDSEEEEERIKKALLQSDEGAEFDSAALRKYQLDRLRYYYAVIECSSELVSKRLYDNMDGQEYLSSANFFDMRFIPDDVTFEEQERDTCTSIPAGYNPSEFTTDALMHSKVKLTWDADDTKRKEVQKKAFSRAEMDENDLLAYIGSNSSSSEYESEEEIFDDDDANSDVRSTISRVTSRAAKRDTLRAALGLDLEPLPSKGSNKRENRPVGDMQITFTPALSSNKLKGSVFENDPLPKDETTAERYARKERERKSKRKERAKDKRTGVEGGAEDGDDKSSDEAAQDAGFDDPFFENPAAARAEAKKAKKANKVRFAEHDTTQEDEERKRAELELLMMEEEKSGLPDAEIKPLSREEKLSMKSKKDKKKGKKEKKEKKRAAEQDDFEVDVHDPRLSSLYEDPDFAIDPTSHMFKDTKGTRALLEEKRKRGEKRTASKSIRSGGEVDDLVKRVKKKMKT